MRSFCTILIILLFMVLAFFTNTYLQKMIRPRESFGRLLLYFMVMLMLILSLSTAMVLLITWFFPGERIR